MVGFQQSYTYFTWRNTKQELEEFLTSVSQDTADFMRPNLFVNTPDILTEYLQFGGPAGLQGPGGDRRHRGADLGRLLRVTSSSRTSRAPAPRRTSTTRSTSTSRATARPPRSEGRSLALVPRHPERDPQRAPGTRPAAQPPLPLERRRRRCSCTRSTSTARFTPDGRDDTVIVVANVDPHSVRETTVHLDSPPSGSTPASRFEVEDLVTGQRWDWGDAQLRAARRVHRDPSHILHVVRGTDD